MCGNLFSGSFIEKVLQVVTDSVFCSATARSKFYNIYTLHKHQRETGWGKISNSGFERHRILVKASELPGAAAFNNVEHE